MEATGEIVAELRSREPVFHDEPCEDARDRLERLMVGDFFEIGASGRIYTRENVIERVLSRHEHNDPAAESEIDDFSVREIGPHAYIATYTLTLLDGHAKRISRRASVWTDRAGHWQVLYHQGTLAEPTPV